MSRTRSEYRLDLPHLPPLAPAIGLDVREVTTDDRAAAARLLLAAYRGTIDDEGETDDDALDAIDDYFGRIIWPHSVVAADSGGLIGMSFVVVVDDRHYIDPVATAAANKGRGVGRTLVTHSLRSLAAAGVTEVGATITDGNSPSERLFTSLGFTRVGAW